MRIFLSCSLLALSLWPPSTQAEWGDYLRFTSVEGVVMYISYNNHSHCTDVAWKTENTSSFAVLPSIESKQYTCQSGHVESSEKATSMRLRPGNSSIPQRDHCVCEGEGGVMQSHATLNVTKP